MIARRRATALGGLLDDPAYAQYLTPQNAAGFVMMGMLVGVVVGRISFKRFFVEGITTDERRNMLIFAAAMGLWWGLDKAFDLQKETQ